MPKQTIIWYKGHVSDLREQINLIKQYGLDSCVANLCHPIFQREMNVEPMKTNHQVITRSDLILTPNEWFNHFVLKISSDLELDSESDKIRKRSEWILSQELNMAEHLIQNGYVLFKLKHGKSTNLARQILQTPKCVVLTEIPMTDERLAMMAHRKDSDIDEFEAEDTWDRWNNFRSHTDFSSRVRLALTMTEDIPSSEEIKRWLGEPVEMIIIPDYLFVLNSQSYPVLSRNHQNVLAQFLKFPIYIMVKTHGDDTYLQYYVEYLDHLATQKFNIVDPLAGMDDLLQIPLQPLYDNLECYTYEVFEKDPVKYHLYQKAIEACLVDRVSDEEISKKVTVVMVVGAGRGPLVRATINASKNTGRQVKIYIVEKNPNAIPGLYALREELWADLDMKIFAEDMRDFNPPEKADIMVSELLGSFGDNELSPECLDGAQRHLKPDGVSIPCNSTSFINPVMSSKLYNAVRVFDKMYHMRDKNSSVIANNYENTYVVYPKNVYHIAQPQSVFKFVHPNKEPFIDNNRFKTLEFTANVNCVLHGFTGYFESVLYKDIQLSINPHTHTKGLSSWFSLYFPIAEPQQVLAGQKIITNFWRCSSSYKVWYEWSVSAPQTTHIHNSSGRFCPIFK